jgi:hypothetical protein
MSSAKIVTAKKWREMETTEILQSIEIAARVLKDRDLTGDELRYLALVISDLARVIHQKP